MNLNAFDYYQQLRQQQLMYNRLMNPQVTVPKHVTRSVNSKIMQTRQIQRQKRQIQIQKSNMHIMKKLFSINKRKPTLSHSTPNLSLPPIIKKPFIIPQHDYQNNLIAQKLIKSKPHIVVKDQLNRYHTLQKQKQKLSKFAAGDGAIINRQKYMAELMLLKKLRIDEQTESRLNIKNKVDDKGYFSQH